MKCIFIGNPVPSDFIVETVNINYSQADNIAQNMMIEGLYKEYGDDLTVITQNANFDNPKILNKKTKKGKVVLDCGIEAVAVGNLNYNKITLYLSIIFTYTKMLFYVSKPFRKERFVVVSSGPHIFVSLPILILKLLRQICFISFLIGSVEQPEVKGLFKIISKLSKYMVKIADGTITFVESSSIDYTKKPYCSILYSIDENNIMLSKKLKESKNEKHNKVVISYTGALTRISGMESLIALIKSAGLKYRFVICGDGEYRDQIISLSKNSKYDISYLGTISYQSAIKVQHESDILIVLRSTENKVYQYYSKYAASGKLIDYLLANKPIITPNIQSISSEIKPYLFLLENQEINTIMNMIEYLCDPKNKQVIQNKTSKGRQYVIEKVNNDSQMSRVVDFIEKVFSDK